MGKLSGLDPRFLPHAERFIQWAQLEAKRQGVSLLITSAKRSSREQRRLYAAWKAGRSKYPVAVPGTSMHELGLAVDLAAPVSFLNQLGPAWERFGGRWGGRFNDPIHFEARTG